MNEKQLKKINNILQHEVDSYDAATLSKLRQARERALDAADKGVSKSFISLPMALASAGVIALTALFISSTSLLTGESEYQQIVNEILLDDSIANALMTEEIDMEFYENIEFYQWLEQNNQNEASDES